VRRPLDVRKFSILEFTRSSTLVGWKILGGAVHFGFSKCVIYIKTNYMM
jgi:hypothetical protein